MPRPVEPRPLRQHHASTVFVRVPSPVWPLVSTGQVREFRCATGNAPQLWDITLPSLAVAYRKRHRREYDYRLVLLEAMRREALGGITDKGLAAAGYVGDNAFAAFRRDWTLHEKKKFEPLRTMFVYTVRLVQPDDLETVGLTLIEHLYGEYTQQAQAAPRTVAIPERPVRRGGLVASPGRRATS
jgi:hypothetical protein